MTKKWTASYNRLAQAVCMACLGLAAQQALAQQPAQSQQPVEEVTVTGTRLATSGVNTPTPVTAVTSTQLQTMNPGTLIQSLSQLPVFDQNLTTQQAVGGSVAPGGSNLNLRGLDAQRTLVLLDGHRMAPTNKFGTVDVGVIPEALVQSVEAVTGGASAAYGADAVAGVVNFRLNRSFSGLKYSVQGGTTTYRDDNNYKASVAYGTDIGQRGHIIASVETYHKDGIGSYKSLLDRSSWYNLKAQVTNPNGPPTYLTEQYVQPTNYTPGGILLGPALDAAGNGVALPASLDHLEFLPNGTGQTQPLPFSGIGQLSGGCNCQAQPTLNYGVNSDYQIDTPADRISMFTHFDYKVGDHNSFSLETLLADTSDQARWQTVALLGPWGGRVFADNPFLPATVRQTMQNNGIDSIGFGIFTPNTPGNPFYGSQLIAKNRYGQFTGGFTHDMSDSFLAGGWSLQGYAQYAQNRQETVVPGGMRVDRLFLAMDAVTDPTTGQPVCRVSLPQYDPTGIFSQCVPIDLFGGTSAVTPAAANYVVDNGKIARGRTTEDDVELNFRGNLTKGSGGALGAITAAFGLSWREEQLNVRTVDPCDEFPCTIGGVLLSSLGVNPVGARGLVPNPTGDPALPGVPGLRYVPFGFEGDHNSSTVLFSSQRAVEGAYSVREAFFEFGIPLLQDGKLNLDEAARAVSYTGSGNTQAWKSGVSYQATPKLRIRATRSQDIRAPTLQERFESQRGGTNVTDPANGNQLISTASYQGGNPNVGLETALTNTVGIVYQPVDKFSMTLDWYDINLADAINLLGFQTIVDDCYNSAGHTASPLCQFVHRDPPNPGQTFGDINRVDNLYVNAANQRVNGFDIELNYSGINVGRAGTLSWRLLGSRLNENSITFPNTPKDERAGEVGGFFGGYSLPKNKVTTSLQYAHGPVSVFLQERFIGGGVMSRNYVTGVNINDNHVDSVTYTDLTFNFSGGKSGSTPWQFYFTANNVFNTAPPATYPQLGRTGVGGPNSVLYDTIGRRFVAGIRVNY